MKSGLFIILFCVFSVVMGQTIVFEDVHLKEYLVTRVCVDIDNDGTADTDADFNNDGEIQFSEALDIISLLLMDSQNSSLLVSVEDLTNFQNLKRLDLLSLYYLESVSNLNISGLERLFIDSCYSLREVDISDLPAINHLRIEDQVGLEYLNLQNGSVANEVFSLFYTIDTAFACIDDLQEEYTTTLEAMIPGTLPNTKNCVLGSNDYVHNNAILLYPNPTSGSLSLSLPPGFKEMALFSIDGQLCFQTSSAAESLDISNFKDGLYVFKVTTASGMYVQKIIKY